MFLQGKIVFLHSFQYLHEAMQIMNHCCIFRQLIINRPWIVVTLFKYGSSIAHLLQINLLSKLFLELVIVGKLGADVLSHLVFLSFSQSNVNLESQFGLLANSMCLSKLNLSRLSNRVTGFCWQTVAHFGSKKGHWLCLLSQLFFPWEILGKHACKVLSHFSIVFLVL